MNEDQVRLIVEEWVADNQPPHIPVQVESVTESGGTGLFNVVLSTSARTYGNFDYPDYYRQLEAQLPSVVVVTSGLEPENWKSALRRDPDKTP